MNYLQTVKLRESLEQTYLFTKVTTFRKINESTKEPDCYILICVFTSETINEEIMNILYQIIEIHNIKTYAITAGSNKTLKITI